MKWWEVSTPYYTVESWLDPYELADNSDWVTIQAETEDEARRKGMEELLRVYPNTGYFTDRIPDETLLVIEELSADYNEDF